jgi:hypothetical protein
MGNIIKRITEMVWGETTLEMGFIKFFITFVIIYIAIRTYIHFVGPDDEEPEPIDIPDSWNRGDEDADDEF